MCKTDGCKCKGKCKVCKCEEKTDKCDYCGHGLVNGECHHEDCANYIMLAPLNKTLESKHDHKRLSID